MQAVEHFEYSEEEIEERCIVFHASCDKYVKGAKKLLPKMDSDNKDAQLFVCREKIYFAVRSTYDDISRYKNYHQDDPGDPKSYSDSVKRAAYLTKWLLKVKPIQVINLKSMNFDVMPLAATINEGFAIHTILGCLRWENGEDNISVQKTFYRELLYDFVFREITTDSLLLFCKTLNDVRRNNVYATTDRKHHN